LLANFPEIRHYPEVFPLNLIQKRWGFHPLFRPEFNRSRILGHRDKEGADLLSARCLPYVLFLHVSRLTPLLPDYGAILNALSESAGEPDYRERQSPTACSP
jgi:hypothetical protein